MLTLKEFADKHNISRQRAHFLVLAKRVPGAKQIGKSNGGRGLWIIPPGAKIIAPKA
jgi:hypothetical protein